MYGLGSKFFQGVEFGAGVATTTANNGVINGGTKTNPIIQLGDPTIGGVLSLFTTDRYIQLGANNLWVVQDANNFTEFRGSGGGNFVWAQSNNRNGNIRLVAQNNFAGNSAEASLFAQNDLGNTAVLGITSSIYATLNYPADQMVLQTGCSNGMLFNSFNNTATNGFAWALGVTGVFAGSVKMVLNHNGNLIMGAFTTLTPPDLGAGVLFQAAGSIATLNPISLAVDTPWQLGAETAAAGQVVNLTRYINVSVGGVNYKLATMT